MGMLHPVAMEDPKAVVLELPLAALQTHNPRLRLVGLRGMVLADRHRTVALEDHHQTAASEDHHQTAASEGFLPTVDSGDPLQTTALEAHSRSALLGARLRTTEGHKQEASILTASADLQQIAALEALKIAAVLEGLRLAVALEEHLPEVVLAGLHLVPALEGPQLPVAL